MGVRKSKVLEKILNNTYRKVRYNVDAYTKSILTGVKQRFHYYFDWKSFNIGFGFTSTNVLSGWKYKLSFDLGFFSCWIYLVPLDY